MADNTRGGAPSNSSAVLEAAEHLSESLDANTDALDRVKIRYRITLVSLIIVAVTLALSIKFNYDGTVNRCEGGNELRREIDTKFESIAESLIENGAGKRPEEVKILATISQDLEQRDCSNINWLGR